MTASAESRHSLTVNMQQRAYDRLWPKADIETESKSFIFTSAFEEKSRHSAPLGGLIRVDFT